MAAADLEVLLQLPGRERVWAGTGEGGQLAAADFIVTDAVGARAFVVEGTFTSLEG